MNKEVYKVGLVNLENVKKQMEEIAGDWNGEDASFISGGNLYDEADADMAQEIADQCGNLIELLADFSGCGKAF